MSCRRGITKIFAKNLIREFAYFPAVYPSTAEENALQHNMTFVSVQKQSHRQTINNFLRQL